MRNLLPTPRPARPGASRPGALHFRYEKAGLVVEGQPVPWNAESVEVEASLRLPDAAPRRKTDFLLRLAGREPLPADELRAGEGGAHRVFFRFAPPGATTAAELLWRDHCLGSLSLPALSPDEFLRDLRVQTPTLFVETAGRHVACQAFVSGEAGRWLASAVLASPTSLVPLSDYRLRVVVRAAGSDRVIEEVAAPLTASQLAGRQALVTVAPRFRPRKSGEWQVAWLVGDRELASTRVRAVTRRAFLKSLRVCDMRFVVDTGSGLRVARTAPAAGQARRVGPCFLVASSEAGAAGPCRLEVRVRTGDSAAPLGEGPADVLVTDGPTVYAPGTVDADDLARAVGFELWAGSVKLGTLPLCPVPSAALNAEGGFRPAAEFDWSPAADEELNQRLLRLLQNRDGLL